MERFVAAVVGFGLGIGLIWVGCLPGRAMKQTTLPSFWSPRALRAWNRAPAPIVRVALVVCGVAFIALTVNALARHNL